MGAGPPLGGQRVPKATLPRPRPPILLAVLLLAFPPFWAFAQAGAGNAESPYDVKAAFLYHFTRYLQWPAESKPEAFTIVVLGDSEVVAPLRRIAEIKTVGTLPIRVRQCARVEEVGHPRILFVSESATSLIPQVLERTRGADILTVGEASGPKARGLAVNFVLRGGSVKFQIDEGVLREARIQASSQLLRLAILVGGE